MKIQRERGGLKCGRLFRQAPIFRNGSRKYTFRLSANAATRPRDGIHFTLQNRPRSDQ